MSVPNRGILYGGIAYFLWGLFPLYWPLLEPSGAVEILAHRMMWSLAAVLVILTVRRGWSRVTRVFRTPRRLLLLCAAAVMISVNWGVFIHTVNSGQALQAALGYFINPLVSVALGVVLFAERLRGMQWAAVALGGLAVAVLTVDYGAPPWMALALAFSFATYGALKKFVRLDGVESLTVETLVMFLPALGYTLLLHADGAGTFANVSAPHTLLLIGAGVTTAVPLLFFGAAAYRIPLSLIGLLQFLTPILQFLVAWLILGEELPASRWLGFGIVWCGLAVFATDLVRASRRTPVTARPSTVEETGGASAGRP